MDKIMDDISKNIKKYRKEKKMTQKELGQKVGVSTAAVSNWETGSNSIDIDSLFKVCDALDIPISQMTDTMTTFDLSQYEQKLILAYREADDLSKLTVIKTLGLNYIPDHLLMYRKLINDYLN